MARALENGWIAAQAHSNRPVNQRMLGSPKTSAALPVPSRLFDFDNSNFRSRPVANLLAVVIG
jgi:hypothetical protein